MVHAVYDKFVPLLLLQYNIQSNFTGYEMFDIIT